LVGKVFVVFQDFVNDAHAASSQLMVAEPKLAQNWQYSVKTRMAALGEPSIP
jgi:hypothetical protein